MKWPLHMVLVAALPFTAVPLTAQVEITQGDNKVFVRIDGKPYTEFVYGAGTTSMKPYLAPLRAATGTIVTRHFPMEKVEGETVDHPHHRGLWFAHSNVNGFDFWNNETTYKTTTRGTIAVKKIDHIKSGKNSGSIDATMEWTDPSGTPLLAETRRMVFYSGKDNRVIDLDLTLKALKDVTFGDDKDGVFAIRLAAGLEEKDKKSLPNPPRTGVMVNAQGLTGEKQAWGKRSEWVDYHGELEGEKVGVAILDHPGNPRHPTYWHARAYGLFAANIFGVKAFTGDKSQDGSLTLKPGETLRFRYRVIIHPGDEKTAGIAAQYTKYASIKD